MNSHSPTLLMLTLLFNATAEAKPAQMVESEQAQWQAFQQQKTINCQLSYAQQRKIYNQNAGQIRQLTYQVGDRVKQNSLLLTFDDTLIKLTLQQNTLQQQQAALTVQRQKKLLQQKVISSSELSLSQTELKQSQIEVKRLQTQLSQQRLYAPFDAIITQRLVEIGDSVNAHSHLLTLAAPNSLQIKALVEEALFLRLKLKQAVNIQLSNQKQHNAHISRLHPTLDSNHRGTIELQFDHSAKNRFAGQRCQLQINISHEQILSIPLQALRHDRQGAYLWSINANGKSERHDVTTGRYFSERVEIKTGLKEGDKIITRGFTGLKNDQSVIDLKEN